MASVSSAAAAVLAGSRFVRATSVLRPRAGVRAGLVEGMGDPSLDRLTGGWSATTSPGSTPLNGQLGEELRPRSDPRGVSSMTCSSASRYPSIPNACSLRSRHGAPQVRAGAARPLEPGRLPEQRRRVVHLVPRRGLLAGAAQPAHGAGPQRLERAEVLAPARPASAPPPRRSDARAGRVPRRLRRPGASSHSAKAACSRARRAVVSERVGDLARELVLEDVLALSRGTTRRGGRSRAPRAARRPATPPRRARGPRAPRTRARRPRGLERPLLQRRGAGRCARRAPPARSAGTSTRPGGPVDRPAPVPSRRRTPPSTSDRSSSSTNSGLPSARARIACPRPAPARRRSVRRASARPRRARAARARSVDDVRVVLAPRLPAGRSARAAPWPPRAADRSPPARCSRAASSSASSAQWRSSTITTTGPSALHLLEERHPRPREARLASHADSSGARGKPEQRREVGRVRRGARRRPPGAASGASPRQAPDVVTERPVGVHAGPTAAAAGEPPRRRASPAPWKAPTRLVLPTPASPTTVTRCVCAGADDAAEVARRRSSSALSPDERALEPPAAARSVTVRQARTSTWSPSPRTDSNAPRRRAAIRSPSRMSPGRACRANLPAALTGAPVTARRPPGRPR